MKERRRAAIQEGLLRRQIDLLEKIAESAGADVDDLEQCLQCGRWFRSVASHEPHCEGP